MCKTRFSEIVSKLENKVSVEVETNYFYWEISFCNDNDFLGTVYRLSKNKKELINYYHNSIGFYDKIMQLAKNKNIRVITS